MNYDFLEENRIIPKADILILAGDIYLFCKSTDKVKYFNFLSENFKQIYWLPGNHEYYRSDIIRFHKFKQYPVRKNIQIVNNQVISIDGVNLIFSTLWGKISKKNELIIQNGVSDFSLIKIDGEDFRPFHFNDLHDISYQFITTELAKKEGMKNIVITHHVPTLLNYPEEYKKSPIKEAFAVDLSYVIEKYQPSAWIYGHSHFNVGDFLIGKTRMLTNQLGYVVKGENHAFKLDAVLEL